MHSAPEQQGRPSARPDAGSEWKLVWSDEFEVDGPPNPSRWRSEVGGHGWGNRELQYYTSSRSENARVENGHLIIEARRDRWNSHEYTSARLNSSAGWTYGRIEVKAKLPSGRGTWPAIWMLPIDFIDGRGTWPDDGEIDIMEHVGHDPDVVHATIHTKAYNHVQGTQKTATVNVPTARTDLNVYAVEWTPREIRAFVNDRRYFTFENERLSNPSANRGEWPFDNEFRLLLNIAVGGTWGGEKGVDPAIWPQRMEIDYVRVYQQK
jgi:licheninase